MVEKQVTHWDPAAEAEFVPVLHGFSGQAEQWYREGWSALMRRVLAILDGESGHDV